MSAFIFRNSVNEVAPIALAKFKPFCSASLSGIAGSVPNTEPLSPMAPAIKFLDKGDAICALTDAEPADSPAMVTRAGSPPKALMFC